MTTGAYYISKAARQILQTLSWAGIYEICKAARGAKTKLQCWTCSTYFIIKSLMTANPIPMNNTQYAWTHRTEKKKKTSQESIDGLLLVLEAFIYIYIYIWSHTQQHAVIIRPSYTWCPSSESTISCVPLIGRFVMSMNVSDHPSNIAFLSYKFLNICYGAGRWGDSCHNRASLFQATTCQFRPIDSWF